MPRKRKPTDLHLIQGTYNVTKHRDREGEPAGDSTFCPDPPVGMSEREIGAWGQIVSECHADVLCGADRVIVELAARNLAAVRSEWNAAAAAQLRIALSELGMTPASRSKVKVPPGKSEKDDPWERIKAMRGYGPE